MINDKNKISVIVPIFNSEAYVEKCLRSVLNQSYENIELIVVDDGSTDNTKNIVNSMYSIYKEKMICITLKHKGVSHARNMGLAAATGDYIIFLDSDDYLDNNIIAEVFTKFDKFDVCFYGFDQRYPDADKAYYSYENHFTYVFNELHGEEAALLKLQNKLWICPGNAIYNRELIEINQIFYNEELRHGEDMLWIYQFLLISKKVVCLPKTGLYCLVRQNSVKNQKFNSSMLDIYKSKELMIKSTVKCVFDEKKKRKLLQYLNKEYIFVPINLSKKIIQSYSMFEIKRAVRKINSLKIPKVKGKGIFNHASKVSGKIEKYEYRLFNLSKYIFFITVKFYYFIRNCKRQFLIEKTFNN